MKARTEQDYIPDDWVSATYLKKCFERKNGETSGFIDSFFEQHARHGKKMVRYCFKTARGGGPKYSGRVPQPYP